MEKTENNKPKKKHLSLSFDECVFRIMKQRKNRYMKKEKHEKLSWSDFIMIKVLGG